MSIDKLFELRAQVEAALSVKVVEERRDLETKLAHLSRLGDGHSRHGRPRGVLRRSTVARSIAIPKTPAKHGPVVD